MCENSLAPANPLDFKLIHYPLSTLLRMLALLQAPTT